MRDSAGLPPLTVEPELCVVARRNDALGRRGRWTAFGVLAVASAAVASAWAAAGAWMVLPFSALELALVAAAFAWWDRCAGDWERLTVAGNRLIVERRRAGTTTRRELSRWRTRVEWDERLSRPLLLRTPVEAVAFGDHLTAEQRAATGRDLRRLTRLA